MLRAASKGWIQFWLRITLGILQIYFKYTPKVYFKFTASILQSIYLNEENYKYASSLYYFSKRRTFETHFLKLNQHFNVNLNYT